MRPKSWPQIALDTAYYSVCVLGCVCVCVTARACGIESWGRVPSRCGGPAFLGKEQHWFLFLDCKTRWDDDLNLVHWAATSAQVFFGGGNACLQGDVLETGPTLPSVYSPQKQLLLREVPALSETHLRLLNLLLPLHHLCALWGGEWTPSERFQKARFPDDLVRPYFCLRVLLRLQLIQLHFRGRAAKPSEVRWRI